MGFGSKCSILNWQFEKSKLNIADMWLISLDCVTNEGLFGCHSQIHVRICDPTPANEALCGKINFELWAKM